MGTTAAKLQAALDSKEAIRQAIIAKDVAVPAETPLSQYPAKIAAIEGGGGGTGQWEIPSEWPGDISEVADDEIKMIVLRGNPVRFTIVSYSGVLNVDWGDGNVEYGISPYSITHDYTNASGGVYSDSVNAEVWMVRFWVTTGTINSVTIAHDPTSYPFATASPIVAMSIGATKISTYWHTFQTMYAAGGKIYSPSLLYVKIKHFSNTCTALYHSSYSPCGIFYFCRAIRRIDLPDSWNNVTDITNLFYGCQFLENQVLPSGWGKVTKAVSLFYECKSLKSVTLPVSWGYVDDVRGFFNQCYALESVNLPSSWGSITNVSEFFRSCKSLESPSLPTSWGSVTNLYYFFGDCPIVEITVPAFSGQPTSIQRMFYGCSFLARCTFNGLEGVTDTSHCFYECPALRKVTLPLNMASIVKASNMFAGYTFGSTSTEIVNIENIGSQTVDCDLTNFLYLTKVMNSIVLNARLKQLGITGHEYNLSSISNIRLPNAVNSGFGGSSPQIDIRYCNLDATALNALFGDLPTLAGKTIRITGNPGASTCDTTIATSKGWTVTT